MQQKRYLETFLTTIRRLERATGKPIQQDQHVDLHDKNGKGDIDIATIRSNGKFEISYAYAI